MKIRQESKLYVFNSKTLEYENVICKCGEYLFKAFLPIYDDGGILEESYCCTNCQSLYHWAYGDVVEKLDDGLDWLLQKVEEGYSAERNLSALRRDFRLLEQENRNLKKELEELT